MAKNESANWIAIGGIIVAVAAVVIAAFQFTGVDEPPVDSKIEGNQSQTCSGTNVTCTYGGAIEKAVDATAEELRTSATQGPPPAANGPWPFLVLGTADGDDQQSGLKIRSSNTAEATQTGWALERDVLWSDCTEDSGFDPDPATQNGSIWHKVRWPTNSASEAPDESSIDDRYFGWAYGGYLVPIGHNGAIPLCP